MVASLDGGLRMGAVRSQGDAVGARAGARGGPLIGDCVRLRLLASIVLYAGDGKQQRAHRPHAEQQDGGGGREVHREHLAKVRDGVRVTVGLDLGLGLGLGSGSG